MIHDTYTFQDLSEICYHLGKYKSLKEDWQADFCNVYGDLVVSFDNDEETMERIQDEDERYAMVTELMDIAMQMGKSW
ncbi:MAG TPA: hypothetical protein H9733_04625 [Candidatus Anaerotignum merdipullorum]|nr:hypothetical protein [Candidatus Anaerotignum merdipullorum]